MFFFLLLSLFTPLFSSDYFEPRAAALSNAKEITEIVNDAFARGDVFRKEGQKRTSQEEVEAHIRAGHTWFIMEYGDERIKSIAAAILYTPDSEMASSIHMLSCSFEHAGKKKGTELLHFVEKLAKDQGKTHLHLSVASSNERLIKHYETLGFQRVGTGEYFSPELEQEYLKPEWQRGLSEPKLKRVDMVKVI